MPIARKRLLKKLLTANFGIHRQASLALIGIDSLVHVKEHFHRHFASIPVQTPIFQQVPNFLQRMGWIRDDKIGSRLTGFVTTTDNEQQYALISRRADIDANKTVASSV